MSITFGDFNKDISELIQSNDPLDINFTYGGPIESYPTTKASATTKEEAQLDTNIEESTHNAILHYLKSNTINVNNNADNAGKDDHTKLNTHLPCR